MRKERPSYSELKERNLLQVAPLRVDLDDHLGIKEEETLYEVFNGVVGDYLGFVQKLAEVGELTEEEESEMMGIEIYMVNTWRSAVEDENEEVRVFVEEIMDGSYGDWKDNLGEDDKKLLKDPAEE